MVEGAPLLRAYMLKTRIEGSNPSLSARTQATTRLWARFVFLALGMFAFALACAQQEKDSTEKVYQSYRAANSRFLAEFQETKRTGDHKRVRASKNAAEASRLKKIIEARAAAGDEVAQFYSGVLDSEKAAAREAESKSSGTHDYQKALGNYKQACAAGIVAGCWNAAIMHANGEGVPRSGPAAVEWFYQAGVGYILLGQRDKALAALAAMQNIDKEHALCKKLRAQLPKDWTQ